MNSPLIIALAPNGATKQKTDHPGLPLSLNEIVDAASAAWDMGVTLLHLHIRTDDGKHSLDAATYKHTIAAIQRAIGKQMVIQMTTESVGVYSPQQQIAAVKSIRPEAVSVALRELIPNSSPNSSYGNSLYESQTYENPLYESAASEFFHWLRDEKIMVQYILFSVAEIERYHQLLNREIIPADDHSVLFVLGRYTKTTNPDAKLLSQYLSLWERSQSWMVCAFGQHEFDCLQSAVSNGGHIRVGFENCLLMRDGTVAESNQALIMQSKKMADQLNRPLADSEQTRIILGAI